MYFSTKDNLARLIQKDSQIRPFVKIYNHKLQEVVTNLYSSIKVIKYRNKFRI